MRSEMKGAHMAPLSLIAELMLGINEEAMNVSTTIESRPKKYFTDSGIN